MNQITEVIHVHRRYDDLVERAVRKLAFNERKNGHCLWSVVGALFGLGSTSATRLCIDMGLNPDMKVKRTLKL